MRRIKQTLEKALHLAGAILKRDYAQPKRVRYKGPVDLVTETDKKVELAIIESIRARFPKHSILAEESRARGTSAERWIIDPLDGTTNFAHGLPLFCVSIGYEENGKVKVGGVYNPMHEEWFWAERGRGATLNGKRIRVSKSKRLSQSLLVTGFPYDRRKRARFYLKLFEAFMKRTHGVRRLGSAALDYCYVASGRFDGFWEYGLNPWDQAAGALIAKEAGARLTDLKGKPLDIYGRETLVTNGNIHDEMLRVINKSN